MLDKKKIMEQIEVNVKNCSKCRLCKEAKNSVPGEGNINSEIVFIGEAPGATEDATGRPFVGRAGRLLEALIKALKMQREDVWIGNIIKHRPPDNRDPLPDEIVVCEPYLTLQLETIKPLLVITLGRFALNYFYKEGKISRDHGYLIKTGKYNVYPIYHPAAALRNSSVLNDLKRDFAKIPKVLEDLKMGVSNTTSVETNKDTVEGQLGLL